jgi:hypothetical protein
MKFPFLIAITASLGGCGFVNAVMPLPDSEVAACLSQGTYLDRNTRQCAPIPVIVDPPPSPEQQKFLARVHARAAKCTTGTPQACLAQAQIEEDRIRVFCETKYGIGAVVVWNTKGLGWPVEMTAEQVSSLGALAIPLTEAAYSGKWLTAADFQREAVRRCYDGNPF